MDWSTGLMLRKPCGELECSQYQFCQHHDLQCYPCETYCEKTLHNFDINICEQQCQDYIHDYIFHYVKDSEIKSALQGMEILKSMIIYTMLVMIILIVTTCFSWALLWSYKKKIRSIENGDIDPYSKKKTYSIKFKDNEVSIISETTDTPLTDTTIAAQTTTSSSFNHQTCHTPASLPNKLPCEDFTLETKDFTGYDNLGMWKVSPVLTTKI
ncbi:uncharacterized protein LOC112600041 [Melanaphis sacchari]|uniref:uncharacterized protein LOC112600041 n=1 Tax=Melanaphis sacchari TaxID=742174 RepID=UPI000DC13170|nr:uncharacterized protein LOC112600041 [Melanaphis sacchari]